MTVSMFLPQIIAEKERIEREKGPEAANEFLHGQTGALIGAAKGTLTGAAVGSVVPVVGTTIGAVVGAFVGGLQGLQDKSLADNIKSTLPLIDDIQQKSKG